MSCFKELISISRAVKSLASPPFKPTIEQSRRYMLGKMNAEAAPMYTAGEYALFTKREQQMVGYREYKCNRCGWVHAAVPRTVVQQDAHYGDQCQCFRCKAPSDGFVPAGPDDAPAGSTIQSVYVPGVWE